MRPLEGVDSFNFARAPRKSAEEATQETLHARKPCEGPRRTVGRPLPRGRRQLAARRPIGRACAYRRRQARRGGQSRRCRARPRPPTRSIRKSRNGTPYAE